MWKVRLYKSTGFNLINVPDDPSLLEQKPHKNFGVIDCLQRYFLPFITIRAYEDDVILGDFLKLYDDENENKYAYYVVNSYTMTSGDTVRLDVAMEPLLTCGGIDNITILDGMTSRHHLAADEEIPFEEDPMLIPRKVYLKPVASFLDARADKETMLVVRSLADGPELEGIANTPIEDLIYPTVDLEATFDPDSGDISSYTGKMCTQAVMDFGTQDDPTSITFEDYMGYDWDPPAASKNVTDGTRYLILSDISRDTAYAKLGDAISKLSQLGRDDIVLDAYFIPRVFYGDEAITTGSGTYLMQVDEIKNPIHRDTGISYAFWDVSDGYKVLPDYGSVKPSDWHNKRILFGSHFAYTFVSPDNNSRLVINPEELYNPNVDYDIDPAPPQPGDEGPTPEQYPKVLLSADLRPGGNMTFTIMIPEKDDMDGLSPNNTVSPYVLSTGSWDNASIVNSAVSGGALKARAYTLSSFLKDEATDVENRYNIENKSRGLRALNPFADVSTAIHRGYYTNSQPNDYAMTMSGGNPVRINKNNYNNVGVGGRADAYVGATGGNEYDKARYDRISARMNENMEFMNAMVPKTQVISKATGTALMNGQGLLVYRSFVSYEDLERFDKIINKYGCKHTTQLTKDMFTNRPRFNYVETQGVSIKCPTVPKSVRDELANALNTGLRIWHVKDVDPNAWNDPVEEES